MKLSKFCDIIIQISCFSIIGLTPIFFQCYTYRCWEINTLFLFQILVEIAVLFWLIKVVIGYQPAHLKIKILAPFILFFFALALATYFSDAFQYSFLGSYNRKMGFITWLHLFLFFLILISEIKTRKQIKRILLIILCVSAIVCLYGICQFFGLDIYQWNFADRPFVTGRIFSTFGQPNFLGSWLLLAIPIAVFSFFRSRNFYGRFFILLLIFFLILCLVLTLSRGAWLGLAAGIVFFGLIWLKLKNKKKALVVFTVLLIAISIFWLYLNLGQPPQKPASSPILDRLESLVFLKKSVTGYTRLICWQIALDLIRQRPILGYGPEMMPFYSVKYYQPHFAIYEAINSYPDRAHNDILDTLLTAGSAGLMTYLWLIGLIFYLGFKTIKGDRSRGFKGYGLPLVILTGLFGYLISLQFSFHEAQTGIYFWLYLGLILILSQMDRSKTEEQNNKLKISPLSTKKKTLIGLLTFIIILFIWQFSVKMVLADFYFRQVLIAQKHKNPEQILKSFEKIFALQPEESYYRQFFAHNLLGMAGSSSNIEQDKKIKFLELGIEAINDIPIKQRTFEAKFYQAQMLSLKAKITREEEDLQLAEKMIQNVINVSPQVAFVYGEWCQLKIDEKKWDEALQICQKALNLYPDLKHPALNEAHRQQIVAEMIQVYERLGQIYFEKKDYNQALNSYRTLLSLDPFQYHIYKKLADIYYLKGDLGTAIRYNLHGSVLNPRDATWPWAIALLYNERGDFKMARQYVQKALDLEPNNQMFENFLEKLK